MAHVAEKVILPRCAKALRSGNSATTMNPDKVHLSRGLKYVIKRAVFAVVMTAPLVGWGDPLPSEREVKLQASADAGDAQALLELGRAYSFGDDQKWMHDDGSWSVENPPDYVKPYIIQGIHKDDAEAKRLILLSAQKGNAVAMAITSSNFFWDHNYGQAVYWARKASAQGNKEGIEALRALKTIADTDPLNTYTAEQRQEIRDALNSADTATPPPGPVSTVTEPVPTPPPAPAISPLDRAKANSIDALARICFGGEKQLFIVLSADAVYNNHEADNTSYAITVLLSIRAQGPYGYLERSTSFACDGRGNVIAAIHLPDFGP